MTLFKKSKNPKLIPKLDITLLILGLNQLIPISRVGGPGGDSPPVKIENWKFQIISFFRKLENPDAADRSVSSRQYV